MKETIHYNINDILRVDIVRRQRRDYLRELNLPLSYFETDTPGQPDIILNIGDFEPSKPDCFVVDHKYHINANYIYAEEADGWTRWKIEILGFEDSNMVINFDVSKERKNLASILIPDFIPQDVYLRCAIQYKSARLGYPTIHAAGLCKDEKAYVLAGRGGVFKTSLTMDLIRKTGFSLLGDELVLLHERQALAFPVNRGIFHFRVNCLPDEELGGFFKKVRMVRYLRAFDPSFSNIDIPTAPINVCALILLTKSENPRVEVTPVPLKTAVRKLVANMKMEMMVCPRLVGTGIGGYLHYMQAYSFVFPDSSIACYWDGFSEALRDALLDVPIYEITIPKTYSLNLFEQFCRTLEILD